VKPSRYIDRFQGESSQAFGDVRRFAEAARIYRDAWRIPTALLNGRYRILGVLNRGAMGCVYKAQDSLSGGLRAIKELNADHSSSIVGKQALKRFHEEAAILKRLSCPGVPEVYEEFSIGHKHYIVMSFIDGNDLERLMKENGNRPFPEEKVTAWVREILIILDYLHSRKPPVIYRDIKPSNIMIDGSGKIFLVDFGIARYFEEGKRGTMIGTPGFAAPEQYRGYAEPRSDLYSLGATAHNLLTGIDPSAPSIPAFHFDDIRKLNPSVSRRTNRLVSSMLNVVIEERPRSARAVLESLATAQEAKGRHGAMQGASGGHATLQSPSGGHATAQGAGGGSVGTQGMRGAAGWTIKNTQPTGRSDLIPLGAVCAMAFVAIAFLMLSLFIAITGKEDLLVSIRGPGPLPGKREAVSGVTRGRKGPDKQRGSAGRFMKASRLVRLGDTKDRVKCLLGTPHSKTFPCNLLSIGKFKISAGFPRGELWAYGRTYIEFDEHGRVSRAGIFAD
jgi:hypothetical protein